jgi:hypothetical protein
VFRFCITSVYFIFYYYYFLECFFFSWSYLFSALSSLRSCVPQYPRNLHFGVHVHPYFGALPSKKFKNYFAGPTSASFRLPFLSGLCWVFSSSLTLVRVFSQTCSTFHLRFFFARPLYMFPSLISDACCCGCLVESEQLWSGGGIAAPTTHHSAIHGAMAPTYTRLFPGQGPLLQARGDYCSPPGVI